MKVATAQKNMCTTTKVKSEPRPRQTNREEPLSSHLKAKGKAPCCCLAEAGRKHSSATTNTYLYCHRRDSAGTCWEMATARNHSHVLMKFECESRPSIIKLVSSFPTTYPRLSALLTPAFPTTYPRLAVPTPHSPPRTPD